MEKNIERNTYRYIANDMESYLPLAQFVAVSPLVQTTLFPGTLTVVVAYGIEKDVLSGVSEFIHDNALNIRSEPIEDAFEDSFAGKELNPASYNEILDMQIDLTGQYKEKYAEIQNKLKEAEAGEDRYRGWWTRTTEEMAELKAQVNAIMTLMKGIIKE